MDEDIASASGSGRDEAGTPIEENLKSRSTWLRLIYMIVYWAIASITGMVGTLVVVLSFLLVLFTGSTNRQLRAAGQSIAAYLYEIVRYLTFNTDDKPFPFGSDFPGASDRPAESP